MIKTDEKNINQYFEGNIFKDCQQKAGQKFRKISLKSCYFNKKSNNF